MGNICGKTESDPFDRPGRVLGEAPPPGPTSVPVPKKVGGPPRTLGGSSAQASAGDQSEAKRKAAEAAQARFDASTKGGGKLQNQLNQQKKTTMQDNLNEVSEQNRREREIAQVDQDRTHN